MVIEKFNLLGRRTSAAMLVLRGCFRGEDVAGVEPWSGEQTNTWSTTVHLRGDTGGTQARFCLEFPEGGEDPIRVDIERGALADDH